MAFPSLTNLNGVGVIGDISFNDTLTSNVMEYFNWGLLNAAGFWNVSRPSTSGAYGGSAYKCHLVQDPRYQKGQIWETPRMNWVWESGLSYATQPIPISGIYLNNSFLPLSTSGANSYSLNYPLGRVTFNSPIPASSKVELNYSYRAVTTTHSAAPWFRQLQFNSYRFDDPQIDLYGSGTLAVFSQNRIQLPAIIVEAVPRRTFSGYQLGGGQWVKQDLLFHIFAEVPEDRDKLVDVVSFQNDRTIMLYDRNRMVRDNAFPLLMNGSIAPSALCYPDIIQKYSWKGTTFTDTSVQDISDYTPGLFMGIVRTTTVTDFAEI